MSSLAAQLTAERCDVQELLNDVHCIIEAMIGRGADVALRKPEMQDIPQVLLGDPDRVRGILLNLSTNAAKFTKKGHITMRVLSLLELCMCL